MDINLDQPPSPTDFLAFLPWVSNFLSIETLPVITRVEQNEFYLPAKQRTTVYQTNVPSHHTHHTPKADENARSSTFVGQPGTSPYNTCHIEATYDKYDNLVQIKFYKNRNISRKVLQVISLALPFHKFLTAIHVRGGLKHDGLYELAKIVAKFNITEAILDDTVLTDAKYYTLLKSNSCLKYLSLSRCQITDEEVKEITDRLIYPSAASKTLSVLNLSSNRITDVGAKYLGDMLRVNCQLAYLNLSSNMITDSGSTSIFNSLIQFPLTTEENRCQKMEYVSYLKQKLHWEKKYQDIRIDKSPKRKMTKSMPSPVVKSGTGVVTGVANVDDAEQKISDGTEPYKHPFRSENTVVFDKVTYCLGNNTLCCLNLAYNDLSYLSVKKLYNVLDTQRSLKRSPRGLIKVCIDGNNIPDSCQEMKEIENMITSGLSLSIQSPNASRRKTILKATPK